MSDHRLACIGLLVKIYPFFVREFMPTTRFKKIKSYIHVCHNEHIDPSDKSAKLGPLFDVVNRKVTQF